MPGASFSATLGCILDCKHSAPDSGGLTSHSHLCKTFALDEIRRAISAADLFGTSTIEEAPHDGRQRGSLVESSCHRVSTKVGFRQAGS